MIAYTQGASDLSVTVNSLKTVAASTPITGITIGLGLGTVSGTTCTLQLSTGVATLGQDAIWLKYRPDDTADKPVTP